MAPEFRMVPRNKTTFLKQTDSSTIPFLQTEGVLEETVEIDGHTHHADGYTFHSEPDQVFLIQITSEDFTPGLIIVNPDTSETIASSTGEAGIASLALSVPDSGHYGVIILATNTSS